VSHEVLLKATLVQISHTVELAGLVVPLEVIVGILNHSVAQAVMVVPSCCRR
jgi:hypothetical protein